MNDTQVDFNPTVAGTGTTLSGSEIAERVKARLPEAVVAVETDRGQTIIEVKRESLLDVCRFLNEDPELFFNYLSDVTNVDNLKRPGKAMRYESIAQLYSIPHNHRIGVRVRMPEDDPTCPSVAGIWRGADWHERESYDLMGIVYEGHPDLRRIMMPDEWIGHPLRKDHPLGGVKSFFYKQDTDPHHGEPPGYVPRIRVQEGDI